jgi:hypothetical protein
LTVEAADATWRIYDDNCLVAEAPRTTAKPVARVKVHKPEPPRHVRGLYATWRERMTAIDSEFAKLQVY